MIRTENLQGPAILPWLGALAALRIEIFRDWPYLYEGSAKYEQAYLQAYTREAGALVVIAFDGDTPVGASTGLPLTEAGREMIAPVLALGLAPERIFYFGESVLRPQFRGQGIGRRFFAAREAYALASGAYDTAMFYAVRRAADHPARPAGAASLEGFWRHRGFAPLNGAMLPDGMAGDRAGGAGDAYPGCLGQTVARGWAARVSGDKKLRLGMLQYAVTKIEDFAQYAARVEALVAQAAPHAELLLMPEYACMELAGAGADSPGALGELDAVCALSRDILELFRGCARRHRIWLQPGTIPFRAESGVHNRAPLISPNGDVAFQDKFVMTRFEAEEWGVQGGAPPCVFETKWGRIGIAICYDCEFPALVRAQVEAGAWLILVPTCTDTLHGFNRVRLSAQARAIENQCFVAVAPMVGDAPWLATLDCNRGQAAVYGPVDRGFAADGVIAEGIADTGGWVYAELDAERLVRVRSEGAVRNHRDWPGPVPDARVLRLE